MSENPQPTQSLSYEQSGPRTGLDITEYEGETQILFPEAPGIGRWQPLIRLMGWSSLAVLCCLVLMAVALPFVVLLFFVVPIALLLIIVRFAESLLRTGSKRVFDLLAVNATGIRLEHHLDGTVREVEVDWKAIRTYQFRLPSVQLRMGPVLGFETIGGDYMIELHQPIDRELEVLDILDRYLAQWARQFTAAELVAIEREQDLLTDRAALEA